MRKLKTGDEVIVITGKDKGKRGTITKVLAPKSQNLAPFDEVFELLLVVLT